MKRLTHSITSCRLLLVALSVAFGISLGSTQKLLSVASILHKV